jgi:hypothetical protein
MKYESFNYKSKSIIMNNIVVVLAVVLLSACTNQQQTGSNPEPQKSEEHLHQTDVLKPAGSAKELLSEWNPADLNELQKGRFTLENMVRDCDESTRKEFNDPAWEMTPEKLPAVLKTAEPIDGNTWHYQFAVLPCEYSGILKIGDKRYKIWINAGSYASLTSKDTSLLFGFYEKKYEPLFLIPAGNDDQME